VRDDVGAGGDALANAEPLAGSAGSEVGAPVASDCETEAADNVAVSAVEGAALRVEPLWAAAT